MASLRDTRNRISSVKNTQQITRAMKLVAGAKLNKAVSAAEAARPYQDSLNDVLQRVVGAAGDIEHPLLLTPENSTDVLVVILTSDRGLCGGFNSQICRHGQKKIDELKAAGKNVRLWCYGKKGLGYFKSRGYEITKSEIDLEPARYSEYAEGLLELLQEANTEGTFGQVFLCRSEYVSIMTQHPRFEQILPMSVDAGDDGDAASGDYLYEPDGEELLGRLLPMALRTRLFQGMLESQAGEQASRMTAMDAATRNASDLIDSLKLEYNRARQAAITKELIEIVSGAEAL